MIFPDSRVYICKYCKRKIEASAGSNLSRLINHLYEHHENTMKKDGLMDLYLSEVVKSAFELKGEVHD